MEIVLKKDFKKLGKANDVVTVKDGYARNFLIPQGVAVPATEGNKKMVAEMRKHEEKRESKKADVAKSVAQKLASLPCTIKVKVKNDEEIYGSVSTQDIAEFLSNEGFSIEKSSILLAESIKRLGVYNVDIKLHRDVIAVLKVWVVKEED